MDKSGLIRVLAKLIEELSRKDEEFIPQGFKDNKIKFRKFEHLYNPEFSMTTLRPIDITIEC